MVDDQTDEHRRMSAAYHEAGHAFMCAYWAVPVYEVAGANIHGEGGHVHCAEFDWEGSAAPKWKEARRSIMIQLAGVSAQRRWRPRRFTLVTLAAGPGRSDFEKAHAIARRYRPGESIGRDIDECWDEAMAILQEPANWAAVERIAQRLLVVGRISGEELKEHL